MNRSNIIPLAMKYTVTTGAVLIMYFLLMKLLGFETVVELRFINFIILLGGLRLFILRLKKENNAALEYLSSLAYGFLVSVLTTVFFAVFIFLYLSFIDKGMMEHLKVNQPFGEYLTPGSAFLVLILEGCSSGAIISFALVQFMSREGKISQAD